MIVIIIIDLAQLFSLKHNTEIFYLSWNCCSLVTRSCPSLCDPMDCSTPGFPVLHHFLELAKTHVHQVSDAIEPPHPLSSPSPLALNLSKHQVFSNVGSLHQVAKVLELQVQHQYLH